MSDMVFDGNTLTWASQTWPAVSGPFGLGKVPTGYYAVERRRIVGATDKIEESFKDRVTGQGFFVPITSLTGAARSSLGIHPDGGKPGTEGCIGIQRDAMSFYGRIANTSPGANLTLRVM